MEFYQNNFHECYEIDEFQFPTGWNSTRLVANLVLLSLRFNSQRDGILLMVFNSFSARTSFNSQRDGILLAPLFAIAFVSSVSIPNGMEFYPSLLATASSLSCFNSQRDGILRYFGKNLEMGKGCFNSQRDGILLPLLFRFP